MCNDPNTTIKRSGEKEVHWMDEVAENNRAGKVYKQSQLEYLERKRFTFSVK